MPWDRRHNLVAALMFFFPAAGCRRNVSEAGSMLPARADGKKVPSSIWVAVLERFLLMGLVCRSFTSLARGWFLLKNCTSLKAVCVCMQGATVNFALESHNFGVMLTRTLRQNIRWKWEAF